VQTWTERDLLLALLFRSLYPLLSVDNWQVMLMLVGRPNTIKSVLIELISMHLTPPALFGTISNEPKFFMSGCVNKLLCVFPDMGEADCKIDPGFLKQAISGSTVTVRTMHNDPYTEPKWKAPFLGAMNLPGPFGSRGFKDAGGGLKRRILQFFVNRVPGEGQGDTTLLARIVEGGLLPLLLHGVRKFEQLDTLVGTRLLKDCKIEYFIRQDFVPGDTDPIRGYIRDHLQAAEHTNLLLKTEVYAHFLSAMEAGDEGYSFPPKPDVKHWRRELQSAGYAMPPGRVNAPGGNKDYTILLVQGKGDYVIPAPAALHQSTVPEAFASAAVDTD